jgi:hypothetical protein
LIKKMAFHPCQTIGEKLELTTKMHLANNISGESHLLAIPG